jgi:hypothetical protein
MFTTVNAAQNSAIDQTILSYFHGYLNAEPETLLSAFHVNAKLQSIENSALEEIQLLEWVQNIRERNKKGGIRKADVQILGIDISGDAAVAKTKIVFEKFFFIDYLSLLQVGDRWIIVNKIYTTQQL